VALFSFAFFSALAVGACKKGTEAPEASKCGEYDTCRSHEVCCNPSCGICVEEGGSCSRERCE
jgi:hypothetical protein